MSRGAFWYYSGNTSTPLPHPPRNMAIEYLQDGTIWMKLATHREWPTGQKMPYLKLHRMLGEDPLKDASRNNGFFGVFEILSDSAFKMLLDGIWEIKIRKRTGTRVRLVKFQMRTMGGI